ncbi:MAG: ABC transporter ATP-binding protein [Bacillota bacterium]
MAQIICKDMTLGYEGNVILRDLNFQIHQGEYLCILGKNGAGKSTLLKSMLNLKKPISGEFILGDGLLRTDFSYLTQQNEIQKDFPASVREIVLSGCQNRTGFIPFYNKKDKERANEIMERMGILSHAKTCFRELSGGQQQRVLLSRALCATKKILFLDEPVAGLDKYASEDLYKIIADLNQKDGMTIVMISHDIEKAIDQATHILYIGDTKFFGTKDDYLKQENMLFTTKTVEGTVQND